jgi:alginate O-acetyltransferase complex protein AlgI
MQLHSPLYLIFLSAALLAYLVSRDRWRWLGLLLASALFYAALGGPHLLLFLALVTAATYACGVVLAVSGDRKAVILWTGIGLNLFIIILSRYAPLLVGLGPSAPMTTLGAGVISVGVSFYASQAISYVVDVFRGVIPPERHPGRLCLYLCFFPKLLQGPIERAGHLLPQLRQLRRPDYRDLRAGVLLIIWGFFKKVVIADRLAGFVDPVYDSVHNHSAPALLVATVFFAFQLYADFSGYTDMALGSARLFGVRLTQNFDRPYSSTSVAEFWRRWHISLSSWLRDYLFMPVTSWLSRRINAERVLFLKTDLFLYLCGSSVTMLLCGLWHGASWTFVVWGGIHGLYLVSSQATRNVRRATLRVLRVRRNSHLWRGVQTMFTFSLICLAWIFFRASTLGDGWYVTSQILGGGVFSLRSLESMGLGPSASVYRTADCVVALVSLGMMVVIPGLVQRWRFFHRPFWLRWLAYGALVIWVVLFSTENSSSFLYARF